MEDQIEDLNVLIERTAQLAYDLTTLHCAILIEDKEGKLAPVVDEVRQFSDELIRRYHVISSALESVVEEDTVEWLEEHEVGVDDDEPTIESLIEKDPRSMTQFAKDAGITRDTLKRFLSGDAVPHTKTLRGVEKALGLPEGTIDV